MSGSTTIQREVRVALNGAALDGVLTLPDPAAGLVLFAHGSGSSRRNRYVASILVDAGLATLLFDLLTAPEERTDALDCSLRFDIALLGRRLIGAIDWVGRQHRRRCGSGGLPHLFEESGALEQAAHLARDWFLCHLAGARTEALA